MISFNEPLAKVEQAWRKTGMALVVLKHTRRGFSLIELLVVIAIIGILSALILASVTSSRAKARDARRVSGVIEIQKALELYFDLKQTYPSTTPANSAFDAGCDVPITGTDVAVQLLVCKNLFSQVPIPPSGGGDGKYVYKGVKSAGVECITATDRTCIGYALGVGLERNDYVILKNDNDQNIFSGVPQTQVFFGSSDGSCTEAGSGGLDKCYDVKP